MVTVPGHLTLEYKLNQLNQEYPPEILDRALSKQNQVSCNSLTSVICFMLVFLHLSFFCIVVYFIPDPNAPTVVIELWLCVLALAVLRVIDFALRRILNNLFCGCDWFEVFMSNFF